MSHVRILETTPLFSSYKEPEAYGLENARNAANFVRMLDEDLEFEVLSERAKKVDIDYRIKLNNGMEGWVLNGWGDFDIKIRGQWIRDRAADHTNTK